MKYLLIAISLFSLSCSKPVNLFNGDFLHTPRSKEIITLDMERVNLELYGFFSTHIIDTFLVIENETNDGRFISVFSTNNLKPMGRYIHQGKGEGEYAYIVTSKEYTLDSTGAKIWVNTSGLKRELIQFNITKSVLENRTVIDKKIQVKNPRYNEIVSMNYINDSIVLGVNYNWTGKVYIYNYIQDSILSSFNMFNKKCSDSSIFNGGTIIKPDGTKWVGILSYFDQLNFYDITTNESKSISTSKEPTDFNKVSLIPIDERKSYYSDIWCNDKIVIGAYSNKLVERQSDELHLFNWEGELLHIFKVNMQFNSITVDSINDEIYLSNIEEEIFKVHIGNYFDL